MEQHALAQPPRNFRLLDCTVDQALGTIAHPEGVTHVEPRVMDVLFALASSAGDAVSRDDIIQAAWGHPHITDEALSRCISLLRQALRDDRRDPRYIETIPKRGYRLLAPLEAADAERVHLAVLPFVNLTGDAGYQHLAEGVTELLTTYLSHLSILRVVSRTSSMRYKYVRMRLPEIARELNATRIVEGSVLRSDRTLQVVVQLIDPATDTHIFARIYNRELDDALRSQNEVTQCIAKDIGALFKATYAND